MNFQKDSVQSLLAQLRAAQDGPPTSSALTQPLGSANDTKVKEQRRDNPSPAIQNHAGASSKQLSDLLSSLGKLPQSTTAPSNTNRQLIAPFGPIASIPNDIKAKEVESDISQLNFSKSLPIISALLADDVFRGEVRRMKVDQDTLERRLWAKGEKVKVEWEKSTRTDQEIARITGKAISPTKKREWDKRLAANILEFQRNTCLPAIDGLAARHRTRLVEMGVPGLGGDMEDRAVRERVRRIMDVLEDGLEE